MAGNRLLRVDPATGQTVAIAATLEGRPSGLAVGGDGRFYVSDAAAHVVRVLDKSGRQVAVIGKPGGIRRLRRGPLEDGRIRRGRQESAVRTTH